MEQLEHISAAQRLRTLRHQRDRLSKRNTSDWPREVVAEHRRLIADKDAEIGELTRRGGAALLATASMPSATARPQDDKSRSVRAGWDKAVAAVNRRNFPNA